MNPTDVVALAELMQQALALHQQGEFVAAERLYQHVLQRQPQHFDALHLLGVLARQRGQPERALELIGQALQIDAQQAVAHCNFGATLQDLISRNAHYSITNWPCNSSPITCWR